MLDEYINQDVNNPRYFFHGSIKNLEVIEPRKSHDSLNQRVNIDNAIFLTSSFIHASSYAFKDGIIANSKEKPYNFDISDRLVFPIMQMSNVNVCDELEGYIYVFEKGGFFNEPKGSLQYKSYNCLKPIDKVKVKYSDFKQYYKVNNDIVKMCDILRNDYETLLSNEGQNEVGPALKALMVEAGPLKNISDVARLWKIFRENYKPAVERKFKRFARTSEEIAASGICIGCSDAGTLLAPIFRMNNIPTVYVQSVYIDWIKQYQMKQESAKCHVGHIFLEIYLNGKWMLFDSMNGFLYKEYDFSNLSLPNGYYAFAKSLNGHQIGIKSLKSNNCKMDSTFEVFDLSLYQEQGYKEIDLRGINDEV